MREVLLLVLLTVVSELALATDDPSKFAPFASAETCRSCHQDAYAQWRESWMSQSWSNPVFQREFKQWRTLTAAWGSEDTSCLDCHAPAAVFNDDWDAKDAVTREGVTCDVCHRMVDVKEDVGVFRAIFDPRADVKYSTTSHAKSSVHSVQAVTALTKSTLCATCHWQTTAEGEPLERTYMEWRQSPYQKNGTTCIDCHMRGSSMDGRPHAHRFPGARSNSPLLHQAARLAFVPSADAKNEIVIEVRNRAVGHHFPTGGAHPTQLFLRVAAYRGKAKKPFFSDQRIFETPLSGHVHQRAVVDSTLRPLETRLERFKLPNATGTVRVDATLVYQFLPDSLRATLTSGFAEKYYSPVVVDHISATRP